MRHAKDACLHIRLKLHELGILCMGILRMLGESFAFATGNDGKDGHIAGIRRPDAS